MLNTLKLSLLLALVASIFAAVPAQARVADLDSMENRIQTLTNNSREAQNKAPLRRNACLQRYAQMQADRQARTGAMFHQNLGPILKSCDLSLVGENVAYGYTSPAAVQKAWMRSPGHRANILNSRFRAVGVGVAESKSGSLYYAVVFGRG